MKFRALQGSRAWAKRYFVIMSVSTQYNRATSTGESLYGFWGVEFEFEWKASGVVFATVGS